MTYRKREGDIKKEREKEIEKRKNCKNESWGVI